MQPEPKLEYAGFLPRFGAYMVDGFILYPAGFIIASLFGPMSFISAMLGIILSVGYHAYFLQTPWCATPGKRMMRVMILRPDGSRLDARGAVERYMGMMIPFLVLYSSSFDFMTAATLCFWLSLVWFGLIWVTEQKTAMHDILCNTRAFTGRAA